MARVFLQDTFETTFSLSGVRKLLVRLGFSFHKASSFLFEAKHDKQEEFVKQYEQEKPKVESQCGRRYFIDGVHPIYGMEVLYYCWLPIGKRLNLLGAFCPDDYEYLDKGYTDKNLTAQSVIELFERIMERHPETKYFQIYLDNAWYQHAKILKAWIEQVKTDKGVTFDLKYLPDYEEQMRTLMTERFRLVPELSTLVVGGPSS